MTTHVHSRQTPNEEKEAAVAAISAQFANSTAAVITEYRGLSVKQLTTLRRALGRDTDYAIVKNTLTKRAAAEAGIPLDESLLTGPTAIAFIAGDPVEAAKGLRDFARANPPLIIKGGVLEGKALTADEVTKIADLESREVLLAKAAGVLKALPTRAAGLFQAPLSQMARLLAALEEKKPAGAAGSADAPADSATDTPSETAAEAEVPVAEAIEIAAGTEETPAEPAE
ncbi:MAG: 50S ribosomal protein L10 [Jatrophihabitans sp.]|uniref:50S ribosomal protein L10 n=1 Tax=Jatrophihabitans sp. TaxID=1932789 RepID=UPI003F7D16E1